MNGSPILIRLILRLLPPDLHHLAGDLEEEFHARAEDKGAGRAHLALLSQCVRSAPLFLAESLNWTFVMLGHYLKTGIRVIRRHMVFSIINVAGLAAGMAVCLLILVFVVDQKSYDRFHDEADSIYRITTLYKSPVSAETRPYATTPSALANLLEQSVTGVNQAVTIRKDFHAAFRRGDDELTIEGIHADSEFLDLFDFALLSGNPATALETPGALLLTPDAAERLFGSSDEAVGSTLSTIDGRTYTVTGIIRQERRSHIRFEAIVSYSESGHADETASGWRQDLNNTYTYARLDDAAVDRLDRQFPSLVAAHFEEPTVDRSLFGFGIQPVTSINLGREHVNEIGMVLPSFIMWFLTGFAAIILLIAGFNYVTLTIARSLNRGREIGVRRVLGAFRGSIFRQLLLESVLMALFALGFASLLLAWLLPRFNNLFVITMSRNQIAFDLFGDPRIYGMFLAFSIVVGLLAGAYPARLFTSFEPVNAIGDRLRPGRLSKQTVRRIITVTQFTFAVIFVVTGIVLFEQFRFMTRTDYGFDREHVINVALQDVPYDRLHASLADLPDIVSVAASSRVPALGSTSSVFVTSEAGTERVVAHEFSVDEKYLETMGLTLLAGRNFDPRLASDSTDAVILGASAVRQLGLGNANDAVGAVIDLQDRESDSDWTVVGVIEDFISNNPAVAGDPVLLRYRPDRFRYTVVKTAPGSVSSVVGDLMSVWQDMESRNAARYEIFDDQLRSSPIIVVFGDFLRVFTLIAGFSLLISCLGLLGMSIVSARSRVRELGIRKMLGATRGNLILVLSKEYLILVGIAVVIGGSLAWLLNSFWLSRVSNSITLGPSILTAGVAGTAAIALATIATQAVRVSRGNLVESLRSD